MSPFTAEASAHHRLGRDREGRCSRTEPPSERQSARDPLREWAAPQRRRSVPDVDVALAAHTPHDLQYIVYEGNSTTGFGYFEINTAVSPATLTYSWISSAGVVLYALALDADDVGL